MPPLTCIGVAGLSGRQRCRHMQPRAMAGSSMTPLHYPVNTALCRHTMREDAPSACSYVLSAAGAAKTSDHMLGGPVPQALDGFLGDAVLCYACHRLRKRLGV